MLQLTKKSRRSIDSLRIEKSVTPFRVPDLTNPSERVVPLPVLPAPEDFKGFEPESPGDWNLPEPRRIFPLPKVDVPTPNGSVSAERSTSAQPSKSEALPWHFGVDSTASSFPSLLTSGPILLGEQSTDPSIARRGLRVFPFRGPDGQGPHAGISQDPNAANQVDMREDQVDIIRDPRTNSEPWRVDCVGCRVHGSVSSQRFCFEPLRCTAA
jgi:hypothetical protein